MKRSKKGLSHRLFNTSQTDPDSKPQNHSQKHKVCIQIESMSSSVFFFTPNQINLLYFVLVKLYLSSIQVLPLTIFTTSQSYIYIWALGGQDNQINFSGWSHLKLGSALFPCKPLIIWRLAFPQHSPRILNTQVLTKTVRQPADNFEIFWWTFDFPRSYLFVDLFKFRRFSWHVKFLKVPENTSINWWDLGGVALKGLKGDGKMEGWPFKRAPKCQYYTE